MSRILLEVHGTRIYSYPAMLYIGTVMGMVAGNFTANLVGLDSLRVLIAMILLTVPAMVGARLLHLAMYRGFYRREPRRIWGRSEGGMSLQGGLLLMLLTSVPLLAVLEIPFARFWDVSVITMLVGMMFTKVGCLLNGCCCGRPTTGWLALTLPDCHGEWRRRIPTQLLEAGLAGLILVAVIGFWSRRPFDGAAILAALLAYSAGRFALQATREEQDMLGRLNIQQTICAVFGLLAAVGLVAAWAAIGQKN